MTIEEAHKQEMFEYIKSAIHYLEMATNVVECDDGFNDGQSDELNKIYCNIAGVIKLLETYMKQANITNNAKEIEDALSYLKQQFGYEKARDSTRLAGFYQIAIQAVEKEIPKQIELNI